MKTNIKLFYDVFIDMLEEEWRLHSSLFGGVRFAMFPVFMMILVFGGTWLIQWSGADASGVIFATHILILLFGVQTGSILFIGQDAFKNVLGSTTFLLYTARTLPISYSFLMSVFFVKDTIYYALLFLLPISIGMAGVGLGLVQIALLWVTLTGMFVLGLALTICIVSLGLRNTLTRFFLLVTSVALTFAVVTGINIQLFTPLALFTSPSVTTLVTGFLPIVFLSVISIIVFEPHIRQAQRTSSNMYKVISNLTYQPFVSATLLDLHRSSGGATKVLFSSLIILAITTGLLEIAEQIIGHTPSPALALGTILSLTAFTTYNWLTQNDSVEQYQYLPVSITKQFYGKFIAFIYVTIPINGLLYFGSSLYLGANSLEILIGGFVFTGLSLYLFGTTMLLAGFSPNEFLFDTVLYATFTILVGIVLIPFLIVSFVVSALTPVLSAGLILGAIIVGCIGITCVWYTPTKWEPVLREA